MSEQTNTPQTTPPAAAPAKPVNKRAKLVFVAVLLVLVGVVWYMNRQPPKSEGFSEDLPKSLAEAKETRSPVLVVFVARPPSEADRQLTTRLLMKEQVRGKLTNLHYVKVQQIVDSNLKDDLAVRYKLTALPTALVLDADGKELARLAHPIAEMELVNALNKPAEAATTQK